MKADWELLADEPDEPTTGVVPPWWQVHVATFLGALVMAAGTVLTAQGAVQTGGLAWVATAAFGVNASCLAAIARIRVLARALEGDDRRYGRLRDLGPWGRREWWLTMVAFGGFVVGLVATALA